MLGCWGGREGGRGVRRGVGREGGGGRGERGKKREGIITSLMTQYCTGSGSSHNVVHTSIPRVLYDL